MNRAGSPRAEAPDPARGLPRSEDAGRGLLAAAGSRSRLSPARRAAYLGGFLAVVVLVVAVVLFALGDPILNASLAEAGWSGHSSRPIQGGHCGSAS